MAEARRFFKFLTQSDLSLNELSIPPKFCVIHGSSIPQSVELLFPKNGYQTDVDYVHANGTFEGVELMYKHFKMRPGQALHFDYLGGKKFKVWIFDVDGCEIDYPSNPDKDASDEGKQYQRECEDLLRHCKLV